MVGFVAITTSIYGIMMAANPDGEAINLTINMLKNTPFRDYRLPGILILVFGAGFNIAALFAILSRNKWRYFWTITGSLTILGWIVFQILSINHIQYFQALFVGICILIILLSQEMYSKRISDK